MPGKYEPLADYLSRLPPEVATVRLSLPEVAAILGTRLPASARTPGFWANREGAGRVPPRVRVWRGAGWRVAHFDWAGLGVTFARRKDLPA